MARYIWKWINERWPAEGLLRAVLDEEIVGGARYAYTLGSAVFITFTIQAATGLMQIFFYVPTVDHAYDSISFLRTMVPFGWLIHGLHFWGANVMVALVTLHMARVFVWGAYKTPRELTWLMGVALLLVTMVFSFTGGPLHWDQRGYWAGEVGTSIAGTAPVVGGLMKRLLRGGEEMSQLTLSRFFAVHVMVLPAALLALFGIHITAMRRFGSVGPWTKEKRTVTGPFWPDQVYKDSVVGSAVLFLLISLTVFLPPSYSGKADPLDTSYVPKPEWNFLFLYQALKYFEGPLEAVGTVGVPTLLVTLLLMLPFIDRAPQRDPFKRPVAMLAGVALAAIIAGLTAIGYLSPGLAQAPPPSSAGPTAAKGAAATSSGEGISRGAQVFKSSGCSGCHSVNGQGGAIGPELSGKTLADRERGWLVTQIRNPKAHFPKTVMPAYPGLTDQEVTDLVDYLLSLGAAGGPAASATSSQTAPPAGTKGENPDARDAAFMQKNRPGPAAFVIGNPDHGEVLFRKNCQSCHGASGTGGVPNPGSEDGEVPKLNPIEAEFRSPSAGEFAERIDVFIQHGSTPAGPAPAVSMPSFGDTNSLTQQEIANIEAYVLRLNGADRGQILNPGLQPRRFFWIVLAVYAAVFFLQGGLRFRKNIP